MVLFYSISFNELFKLPYTNKFAWIMSQLWILKKLNDFFSYSLIFTLIDNGF